MLPMNPNLQTFLRAKAMQRNQYEFSIRNIGCKKRIAAIQEIAQYPGLLPVETNLGEFERKQNSIK